MLRHNLTKWFVAATAFAGVMESYKDTFGPRWSPVIAALSALLLALNRSLVVTPPPQ